MQAANYTMWPHTSSMKNAWCLTEGGKSNFTEQMLFRTFLPNDLLSSVAFYLQNILPNQPSFHFYWYHPSFSPFYSSVDSGSQCGARGAVWFLRECFAFLTVLVASRTIYIVPYLCISVLYHMF